MFCVVDTLHERRDTINSSVNSDIEKIFRGKTSAQLSALRSQINTKISGGGAVDIGELHVTYFYTFLLYIQYHNKFVTQFKLCTFCSSLSYEWIECRSRLINT